jgi:hypothetical protein
MNTFLRSVIYFIVVVALVISAQNIMSGLFGRGAIVASSVGLLHHALPPMDASVASRMLEAC